MEYFIDQEKHFCLILLYTYITFCIGVTAMVAIGTMLIAYLQHTCGMLSISRYRINRAMRFNMLKTEKFIFEEIFHAIDIHRQAMRLSELLASNFEIMLFFLIIFGVTSMSLNLLQERRFGAFLAEASPTLSRPTMDGPVSTGVTDSMPSASPPGRTSRSSTWPTA
ncbi:PREDICTED: uncharacterized protein LOC105448723 [Wasmannia auropunctata]|uniref:uncharacterized protein LOC105448723 n=1 Tax=Wasmannia auropunctata TaxID=64793 RepID=UPI0005F046F9|nr:PREDICTED: uncharacterized protein LOC105448723 [Wasmannia auropunctata]